MIAYDPIVVTGPEGKNLMFYSCQVCGALTISLNRHSSWHKDSGGYRLPPEGTSGVS